MYVTDYFGESHFDAAAGEPCAVEPVSRVLSVNIIPEPHETYPP